MSAADEMTEGVLDLMEQHTRTVDPQVGILLVISQRLKELTAAVEALAPVAVR